LKRACAAATAFVVAACGLVHRDVDVVARFPVGGGAPSSGTVGASSFTGPLAAKAGDLDHLSSVTLQQARLETTDAGDLSFISAATLALSAPNLPDTTLGTLAAPGAVASAQFQVSSAKDLKPYLAAGGTLKATLSYAQPPATARLLQLTLTLRATVL
jgi:hypothetical protein